MGKNCERAIAPIQVTMVQCPPRKRAHHKDWFSIGPQQWLAQLMLFFHFIWSSIPGFLLQTGEWLPVHVGSDKRLIHVRWGVWVKILYSVWTGNKAVLCGVNGLGLELRVSVNPIMKFIYTLCKCIKFIFIHVSESKWRIQNVYV